MKTIEKTWFDTRISKEQIDFFEYAASLSGYGTLTEFVINTVQERANRIVEEHNRILVSKKDQELFFSEITNPAKPNQALQDAANRYNESTGSL